MKNELSAGWTWRRLRNGGSALNLLPKYNSASSNTNHLHILLHYIQKSVPGSWFFPSCSAALSPTFCVRHRIFTISPPHMTSGNTLVHWVFSLASVNLTITVAKQSWSLMWRTHRSLWLHTLLSYPLLPRLLRHTWLPYAVPQVLPGTPRFFSLSCSKASGLTTKYVTIWLHGFSGPQHKDTFFQAISLIFWLQKRFYREDRCTESKLRSLRKEREWEKWKVTQGKYHTALIHCVTKHRAQVETNEVFNLVIVY